MSPRSARILRSVIVTLITAAVTVGCGSGAENPSGTSTSRATAITTTTAAVAITTASPEVDPAIAEAALENYARQLGSDVIYSPVATVAGGAVAVVTYGSPERADVVRFDGESWQFVTSFLTPIGAVVATGVQGPETCEYLCIETANLTGSTNFLVPLAGADHRQLVVVEVADDATSARVVPFDQAGELLGAVVGGVVDGQTVTSSENDCVPSCAEGTSTYTPWSYDPTSEMFRPDLGD